MFIRIKTIKNNKYGYLVENNWRKRKQSSRQKVKEYLGIKIPDDRDEPDWTYKIHFATSPGYYQCYFLGQLMRAQVHAEINRLAPRKGLFSKKTGDYLRTYRSVGDSYTWSELVKHMTGKPLGIEALKAEFSELKLE